MRTRFASLLVLVALMLTISLASPLAVMAQTVDFGTPPAANPGDRGESTGEDVPRFGIVAIGDHPTGYFDDLALEPGTSVNLEAAVVNAGAVPVSLHVYKTNAGVATNGGFQAGKEEETPVGATAWIDFQSIDLDLAPGEQQLLSFTVTVPADAPPGQHIAGLAAAERDATAIEGAANLSQVRGFVMAVAILVPGDITPSFTVGEPVIENRALQIPVTNTGNYLVRPMGQLVLTDATGATVQSSKIQMGSVYAGLSTMLVSFLPDQLPAGEYSVDLTLTDEASGFQATIEKAPVTLVEAIDPTALTAEVAVAPNAEPIAFANVTVTLQNGGKEIPAANVSLRVLRDGVEVETFPLASNLLVPTGETAVTGRYIPADAWSSGTYTFEVIVSAVSQREGTETILLTMSVPGEIVVP